MTRHIVRGVAWIIVGGLSVACGDRPVGSHIPQPDTGAAAGVAAAAAAAAVIAGGEPAMPGPESTEEEDERRRRALPPREPVPGAVFDRLERARAAPPEPRAIAAAGVDAGVPDAEEPDVAAPRTDTPPCGRDQRCPDLRLPPRPAAP